MMKCLGKFAGVQMFVGNFSLEGLEGMDGKFNKGWKTKWFIMCGDEMLEITNRLRVIIDLTSWREAS